MYCVLEPYLNPINCFITYKPLAIPSKTYIIFILPSIKVSNLDLYFLGISMLYTSFPTVCKMWNTIDVLRFWTCHLLSPIESMSMSNCFPATQFLNLPCHYGSIYKVRSNVYYGTLFAMSDDWVSIFYILFFTCVHVCVRKTYMCMQVHVFECTKGTEKHISFFL